MFEDLLNKKVIMFKRLDINQQNLPCATKLTLAARVTENIFSCSKKDRIFVRQFVLIGNFVDVLYKCTNLIAV